MLDQEIVQTMYSVARSVGTELGGQKIPLQVDKVLKVLGMEEAPTVSYITSKMPKTAIGDDTDNWHDDQLFPEYTTLTANHAADAVQGNNVTMTVADTTLFREWDLWRNERTGTVFQVQNVASATTFAADGLEAGGIAAGTSGDVLVRLLAAMDEGGSYPVFKSTRERRYTNYIQFNRDSVQMTDVAMSADDYHGSKGADYKLQIKKKYAEFANALERSFYWNGEPILGVADAGLDDPADVARNRGKFMGFEYYLSTYLPSGSANLRTEEDLTESEFWEWCDAVGHYQPTQARTIFADPNLGLAFRFWEGTKVRFESGESNATSGIRTASVIAPNGSEWTIVLNPQLRARGAGSPYHYVFALNLNDKNFEHVYFNDHDFNIEKNAVRDGISRQVDIIRSYCSFRFRLAAQHGRLRYRTFS
jgi:hypothetical protein